MDENQRQLPALIDDDADRAAEMPDSENAGEFSIAQSLLGLVIGGVIEGSNILLKELRQWETSHPRSQSVIDIPETANEALDAQQMRFAAIGLLSRSLGTARQGATIAANTADSISRKALAPFKPIVKSRFVKPFHRQLDALAERGKKEIEAMVSSGRMEEQRSRQMAQQVVNNLVGEVVHDLSGNPQITVLIQTQLEVLAKEGPTGPPMDELVRRVASNYINYLNEHPEQVQALIRTQGGTYLDYLNENPEPVQNLLAAQSLSLSALIREEVNVLMVTGDSLLEMLARAIFRRTPRAELPGPPPEVRLRATQPSIAGNFLQLQAKKDEPA